MTRRPFLAIAALALFTPLMLQVSAQAAPVAPPDHPTIAADSQNFYVLTAGTVRGAGANPFEQLGTATNPTSALFELSGLPAGVTAESIEGDSSELVVIGSDHRVYGSGANYSRQLTGTTNTYKPFHLLSGLPSDEEAVEASVSEGCTVILTHSGKLYRAGLGSGVSGTNDEFGQCPKDPAASIDELSLMPGVPAGRQVVDVAVGGYNQSLVAVLDDGTMLGSGFDDAFDRLPGRNPGNESELKLLTNLPNSVLAKSVSVGGNFVVVLGSGGKVYGAGENNTGQLTNGSTVNGWHEMAVPGTAPPVQIAASDLTSAVLTDDVNLYGAGNISVLDLAAAAPSAMVLTSIHKPANLGEVTEIDGHDGTFLARGADDFVWGAGSTLWGANPNGFTRLPGQLNVVDSAPTFSNNLTGALRYGATLTAVDATWKYGAPTSSRQWLRNGVPIAGATGPTYVLQKADAGRTISLRNTAVTTNYADTSATSAGQFVTSQLFNVVRPVIKGTAKKGKTLSVQSNGTWTPYPATFGYRWLRNGVVIAGTYKPTYKLTKADNNKNITVRVYVGRPGFIGASAVSSNYKRF